MDSSCPEAPGWQDDPVWQRIELQEVPAGTLLHRFHGGYPVASFNPNTCGAGARFNPFADVAGSPVPTLYLGSSFHSAALESVFHDVPHVQAPAYALSRLAGWRYGQVRTKRPLYTIALINSVLRQLPAPGGRATGVTEGELVHSPASDYERTRTWACLLHQAIPVLDGLCWRPRLGGTGEAFVLFGDRAHDALTEDVPSVPLLVAKTDPRDPDSEAAFEKLMQVARSAGITMI